VTIQIRTFDLDTAPDGELAGYHSMLSAAWVIDYPEDPPITYETALGRLRAPSLVGEVCTFWAAYLGERLVGLATVTLADKENAGIVRVGITVHPELRRQGIGSALLRAVMPAVLESGREVLIGVAMKPDSAAAAWTTGRLGFRVSHSTVLQVLKIASVPARLWDVEVPSGYRLARWIGAVPDKLLDSYAAARPAVEDAPMGQSSFRLMVFTADRIRELEREFAESGVEERVVVAIEDATSQIVGITGMLNYPHRLEVGYQSDTSVLAGHRGHGLGRVMKAAMMRWIVSERPDIEHISTVTAAENTYMRKVNDALGYSTTRTMIWVETTTTQLADKLASIPTPS